MHFYIMTLFPEMVMQGLNTSITGRAIQKGILSVEAVNIRDYAFNKHNSVDDYPYGGGAGMLMQAEPVYQAYKAVEEKIHAGRKREPADAEERDMPDRSPRVIFLSPQGKTFNQGMAEELAKEDELVFLCGHYEGIDERVLEEIVTDHVSIGDYVLTGGELPAMIMADAISRLVPGVLHNDVSAEFESFQDNLLEYPQYSRPEIWHDKRVPKVLLSGHHANVEKWRREQSIIRTAKLRPDLLERAQLTERERALAKEAVENVEKYYKENLVIYE
ncbi:MAG: tRNA (guanosine(37)-N1)-methyltransferase TrmD [Dorea sp.]|nr:tRNA (guanosine(37)-N1)-methyltransferase TrmD [Dorea sp.]MCI9613745.1 tRNA (guanosine(37)-N1)-methyltransferase TrmD [Dorea sp.]